MTENQSYEPVDQAPPDTFAAEDLVVALPYVKLVAAELRNVGIGFDEQDIETDERLGLALLKNLEGLRGRAAYVKAGHGGQVERRESLAAQGLTDLDALLVELRARFSRTFGGWVPEMGKNRHVAGIVPWGPGGSCVQGGGKVSALSANLALNRITPESLAGAIGQGGPTTYIAGPGGSKVMGVWTVGAGPSVSEMPSAAQVTRIVANLAPSGGSLELYGSSGIGLGVGEPEYVDPGAVPPRLPGSAGEGVRVGVLDMPLYPHPDLDEHLADPHALFARYEPAADGTVWLPLTGHATFVASLVAARAPGATVDVRAALDGETGTATAWQLAKAMASFVDTGVDVLNLSIGCRTADGEAPFVLATAVERLGAGTVIVAAAGNHAGSDEPSAPVWPAALPNVIAIGAHSESGSEPAEFSPRLPWVAFTAPGVRVLGAYLDSEVQVADGTSRRFNGWARWSGTSFAAATASGVIAANTRPGTKNARQAASELLTEGDPEGVLRPYRYA